MFIVTPNILCKPLQIIQKDLKLIAFSSIYYHKMTTNDKLLNNYLEQNYHKSLKTICKNLIWNKIVINIDNTTNKVIITFKDIESDNLATLITYGNEQVPGSNLLKKALMQEF